MASFYSASDARRGHAAHYLERDRPDSITITASFVGERVEIDVFEDDHIEISRVRGDESVEAGMELFCDLVKREIEEN